MFYSVIVRHTDTGIMAMRGKVNSLRSLETGDTAYPTRPPKEQQGPPESIKSKQVRQNKGLLLYVQWLRG